LEGRKIGVKERYLTNFGGLMIKKYFVMAFLFITFSIFCFGDDDVITDLFKREIYGWNGWRTEGAFTVESFSISNLIKANNRRNEKQIKNDIIYGESFIFSSKTYSEYIIIFYLKNGGKIEIKCYQDQRTQDKFMIEQEMIGNYESQEGGFEYLRKLSINGFGTFREFDKNSKLIKEKRYDNIIGLVTTHLYQLESNDVRYNFFGEGIYRLTLDSNIEKELIEIKISSNSPYSQ
jgi:hypothetical protein